VSLHQSITKNTKLFVPKF